MSRLSERKKCNKPSISPFLEILNYKKWNNSNKTFVSKLKINGSFVISNKYPNNIVLLQTGLIFKIKQIICEKD